MTLKTKIVLANSLTFGILLAGLAFCVYHSSARNEIAAVDLRLEACGAKVITEFDDEWHDEAVPEWDDILAISAQGLDTVFMVMVDTAGATLFATKNIPPVLAAELQSAHFRPLVSNTFDEGGKPFRYAVFPVDFDDTLRFTLTLMTPIDQVQSRLNNLAWILAVATIACLFIGSIAVYLLTRLTLASMARMISAAESISGDNLHTRLEYAAGRDEVARLGAALNAMMERIEGAFRSQRQFITDASHELRTPLTVIIGELEFLRREVEQERLRGGVEVALQELDRMARLVDQLLMLARLDAKKLVLEFETVRLDELVLESLRSLRPEAERKQIQIEVQIAEAIELQADRARLKSVVLNLVENAIKYSQSEGTIQIELRNLPDRRIQLTVSDAGPGIAPQDLPRIFDRFYRSAAARSKSNGSGLGLAIARELVELHGGTIIAKSAGNRGAVFVVTLPAAANTPQ